MAPTDSRAAPRERPPTDVQPPAKETEHRSAKTVARDGSTADPCQCPVARATGGLLGLSDQRAVYLRRIAEAELAGERRGYERGVADGYAQCAAEVKDIHRAFYGHAAPAAEAERLRWTVRGEPRTRQTFAAPHPDDYVPRSGQESSVA